VNDLICAALDSDLIQYADDTALVIRSSRQSFGFTKVANRAVQSVLKRYLVNRLNFNARKTVLMMFGRQRALTDSLKIGDVVIPRSDKAVYLDTHLLWTHHINFVVSRVRRVRLVLSRISYMFDRSMEFTYQSSYFSSY
jgi:hypothetical protein